MNTNRITKILAVIALIALIASLQLLPDNTLTAKRLGQFIGDLGMWGPVIFITIYMVSVVLLLPASGLTIAGGFIFGPTLGTGYNVLGAMLGATIAFFIARYCAADWVTQRISGRLKSLKEGAEASGWKFVMVMRLMPVVPFNLLNYGLGLTNISWQAYVIASTVFILPGTAVYTYLGALGEAALMGDKARLAKLGFIVLGGFVALMCIPWILKRLSLTPNNTQDKP